VTDHSVILDNSTANTGLVDNVAVTLTTTELVTTTESLTTIQTSTIVVTVTADVSPSSLPVIPSPLSLQSSSQSIINPSPKQSSSAATSCSSNDKDNTPIYIAVVIVVVALLLTAILVIVGVILYRYHKASSARSKTPIIAEYKSTSADDASMKIVEVNNDLYGAEPRSGYVGPLFISPNVIASCSLLVWLSNYLYGFWLLLNTCDGPLNFFQAICSKCQHI